MRRIFLIGVLGVVAFVACDKDKGKDKKDELTIVVQADRTKIEAAEQELEKERAAFEEKRKAILEKEKELLASQDELKGKDLAKVRQILKDLGNLRAKKSEIEQEAAVLEKERQQIAKSKSELLDKVAMSGGGSGAGVVQRERGVAQREKGIATREADVARREKEVAEREAELARREADFLKTKASLASARIPAFPRPTQRGQTVSPAKAEKAYKAFLRKMRSRNILLADLPLEAAGLKKEIETAKAKGDYATMMDLVDQLSAALSATKINQAFIETKFERMNQLARKKQLEGANRQKLQGLLRKATQLYNDGRFAQANRELNKIFSLLTR